MARPACAQPVITTLVWHTGNKQRCTQNTSSTSHISEYTCIYTVYEYLHQEVGEQCRVLALVLADSLQLVFGLLDDVGQHRLSCRKHLEPRLVELLGCLSVRGA